VAACGFGASAAGAGLAVTALGAATGSALATGALTGAGLTGSAFAVSAGAGSALGAAGAGATGCALTAAAYASAGSLAGRALVWSGMSISLKCCFMLHCTIVIESYPVKEKCCTAQKSCCTSLSARNAPQPAYLYRLCVPVSRADQRCLTYRPGASSMALSLPLPGTRAPLAATISVACAVSHSIQSGHQLPLVSVAPAMKSSSPSTLA